MPFFFFQKRNTLTKIWGKSQTFWKRDSSVSIGRRVKFQKPLSLSFVLYNFAIYTKVVSQRSRSLSVFCDPGSLKHKFEYNFMLVTFDFGVNHKVVEEKNTSFLGNFGNLDLKFLIKGP